MRGINTSYCNKDLEVAGLIDITYQCHSDGIPFVFLYCTEESDVHTFCLLFHLFSNRHANQGLLLALGLAIVNTTRWVLRYRRNLQKKTGHTRTLGMRMAGSQTRSSNEAGLEF